MKNLHYLNKYFWKYRGRLFMGFLLIIAGNIFAVYAPVVVRDGIDLLADALSMVQGQSAETVTVEQPSTFRHLASFFGSDLAPLELNPGNYADIIIRTGLLLAGLYLLMFLMKGVFLFYQRQALIVMSRHMEFDLKNEIYDKYQELDLTFYKQNRTGDLMNRISEDVNRVRMYLGPAVMYTLNLIVLLVMCVVVMWKIDRELTLYALSPMPFMMIAIFYVSTLINRRTDQVQKHQSRLSTMVQESISGIRILKGFHREKYFSGLFEKESTQYKEKQLRLVKVDAFFMPVMVILVGLSTLLTVFVGAHKVMEGEISAGVIVQFVFYVNILTWPFAIVGWVTSLVQKAEASQARINEFLRTIPAIENTGTLKQPLNGDIEFRNVTYTYPDSGIIALDHVSFRIDSGKTLGIVGRTGSGKSTIANLLLRMMNTTSGEILIDGQPVASHDLSHLRKNIGYVPQEVFLFSDSIHNNIAFGKDDLTDEEISQAAIDADIHDTIQGFADGYQTILGERGINLSGGQKQRISIARALVKKPTIFVFDDCLSAVDTETEDHILSSLRKAMATCTGIIIAHRISSVKEADHIIVLDHGKIRESGNHQELLSQDGLYAAMYRQQSAEKAD
jgi:ATP-binding cassette subfamily B multidrug efflux pump